MTDKKLRAFVWRGIVIGCLVFWIALAYIVSKAVGL